MNLFGVDVSAYQPWIDVSQLQKSGDAGFASIKCCDAIVHSGRWTMMPDSMHDRHHQNFRSHGVPTQSYAFFHPSMDIAQQVTYFVAHAFYDQMRPVLDCESTSNGHIPANAGEAANEWCQRVLDATGVRPIIYASTSYANEMARQCGAVTQWDLHAAEYHDPPNPNEVIHAPGWNVVAVQFAGNVKLAGVAGLADRDVTRDLQALCVP